MDRDEIMRMIGQDVHADIHGDLYGHERVAERIADYIADLQAQLAKAQKSASDASWTIEYNRELIDEALRRNIG